MVGSSKILTVSYGTFSCTLEGFDDSFETMKAIAEYFRDLAADDRYFGAEPPTPDAEMLARIAEREISRRVEAHEERGRIVLRADQGAALAAVPAAQAEAARDEEPATVRREADTSAEPAASAGMAGEDEIAEVARDADEAPEEMGLEAEAEAEDWADEAADPETAGAGHLAETASIADKLDRIRSVVGDADEADEDAEEYSEDEHAEDFLERTAADLEAALAEDADEGDAGWPKDMVHAADHADETGAEPDEDAFEDTLAALLADSMPGTEDEAAPRPERARIVTLEQPASPAAHAPADFEVDENDEEDAFRNFFEAADTGLLPEEEEALRRELADVESDVRLAFEDLGEDDPSEDDDEADWEEAAATQDVQVPSPRDSAAEAERAAHGRHKLEQAETSGDLMRFFDEADTQLDAPASSQRRNAIQHLRAAVAATRAEQKAGSQLHRNVDESPYRSDLASVVRPRRPQVVGETGRSMRPEENRPAPLKLVAEQRIDMPRAPIQPRRISGAALRAEFEQADAESGFAAFAEEVGAAGLPDLLEAAAAYLADVEDRPQFSRPMLMGKLKEIEAEEYSREEGLRSFGQLLRTGKLQKLSGGRFAVTDLTEFRSQGKRHAG